MLALALACLPALAGCSSLAAVFGGMAESHLQQSNKTVEMKYDGLRGKSFAVVVAADRIIQADYPTIVGDLTITISKRLADPANNVGATGFVPGERVLEYQYSNPRWVAMMPDELATELGVQRLVFIDLQEFRLSDPGNQYLWAGVASGTIRVLEADSRTPGLYVLTEPIHVQFPDQDGFGPAQMPATAIQVSLARRFADRASWLFYQHEEPYYSKY